jgi:hypothetical protein
VASQIDDVLLDSIVAGVLDRLRGASAPVAGAAKTAGDGATARGADAPRSPEALVLSDHVLTEAILEEKLKGAKSVRFAPKAVLTPTARDYLRRNGIEWAYATKAAAERKSGGGSVAALVVRSTPVLSRVITDVLPGARTELLSCPDDAAKLAIAEIARGGVGRAVIFAEQTHRAACLANRHEAVKAVAVRDVAEVAAVRKQLRANVWCLDPGGRGYFDLRNVVRAINS